MPDRWETGVCVTRSVIQALIEHARRAEPDECCGLLLGGAALIDQARPAANVAADRRHRFEIDPQALVDAHRAARAGGPALLGYYHSHPQGVARPSEVDRALAGGDGRVWAIIAKTAVTFWHDGEAGLVPLSYTIEDR